MAGCSGRRKSLISSISNTIRNLSVGNGRGLSRATNSWLSSSKQTYWYDSVWAGPGISKITRRREKPSLACRYPNDKRVKTGERCRSRGFFPSSLLLAHPAEESTLIKTWGWTAPSSHKHIISCDYLSQLRYYQWHDAKHAAGWACRLRQRVSSPPSSLKLQAALPWLSYQKHSRFQICNVTSFQHLLAVSLNDLMLQHLSFPRPQGTRAGRATHRLDLLQPNYACHAPLVQLPWIF